MGDPNDADTVIGPVINKRQLQGLQARIADARRSAARQVVGGKPDGPVLPPHVFAELTGDMPLAREEQFGPIAFVIRAHGEAEARDRQPYGLLSVELCLHP